MNRSVEGYIIDQEVLIRIQEIVDDNVSKYWTDDSKDERSYNLHRAKYKEMKDRR
jgi:hypothetical protein